MNENQLNYSSDAYLPEPPTRKNIINIVEIIKQLYMMRNMQYDMNEIGKQALKSLILEYQGYDADWIE